MVEETGREYLNTANREAGPHFAWANYSPKTHSYQTQAQSPQNNTSIAANCASFPHNIRSATPQAASQHPKDERFSSRDTGALETYISCGLNSKHMLTYLLGATIFASFLNTFLLTFVVKSIQLNDGGFINGRLTWDEQSNSTFLQLLAQVLPGKSISVRSIESFGDKPLRLDIRDHQMFGNSHSYNQRLANTNGENSASVNLVNYKPLVRHDDGSFLIVGPPNGEPPNAHIANDYLLVNQRLANQLANTNPSSGQSSLGTSREHGTLEIGTNELVLDLIDDELSTRLDGTNNLLVSTTKRQQQQRDFTTQDADSIQLRGCKRLLEFDSKHSLISLPCEDQLNLESTQKNSLVVDHLVECSNVTGTLDENLEIQTRGANLIGQSEGTLRLSAKSGSIKMTAFEELVLDSKAIIMRSAKKLYLPSGIQYFDTEPENLNEILPEASANGQQRDLPSAYNLVVINGILMGSA